MFKNNLTKVGLDETWLMGELFARGVLQTSEVMFASLDTQGQLFVVREQDVPSLQALLQGDVAMTHQRGLPPRIGDNTPH